MPNRVLRDWTTSDKVNLLSEGAEVTFTRLIMKADDYGSFHANLKLIKASIYPLKDYSEVQIGSWLNECIEAELILTYMVEGKQYIRIKDFNQRLRAMRSTFPHPDSNPLTTGGHMSDNGRLETKRNETESNEKRINQKILVFGEASDKYFIINPSTLHEPKYRVNSTGFREFADKALLGTWFKKEYLVDMFWDQWSGKMFNDIRHVSNVMLNINNPKKNGQSNN